MVIINIIVHHPKSQEAIVALHKKAAAIHADAVIRYINKLPCPKEQKITLCNEIKKGSQKH